MTGVAYATALVLAAVFAWAGVAKLRNRATTAVTIAALGLPAPRTLAVAVPGAELVLAIGLVVVPGWSAVAAVALLAGFTTFLVRAMRSGVEIGCGCFGTARREPVSFVEVVRNGLLAAAALVATAAPAPAAVGLDDVVLVSTAAAAGAVVLALCDVKRRTGHLIALDLP
jgi:uncharacterized membrane protein YphA (DoxX/SURF4 family)